MIKIKHYGDITKIDGHKVEIPNIITGGSPCQDLSVAGKREGLAGERSGLFMEQVRLTKELREQDVRANGHLGIDIMPRFFVWENVPGVFSSNNGEDFRVVLEEIARIADNTTVIPRPSGGDWSTAGVIMGRGFSIAWRLHDAQFWGVPQRRRRVCLIADFGSENAYKILFDRKGVSGDSESIKKQKQRLAGYSAKGIDIADRKTTVVLEGNGYRPSHRGDGYSVSSVSYTLNSVEQHAVAYEQNEASFSHGKTEFPKTLSFRKTAHPQTSDGGQGWVETEVNDTLNTFDTGEVRTPTLILENHPQDSRVKIKYDGVVQTLPTRMGTGGGNVPLLLQNDKAIIRRLTPLECERLQGFPDGWTDIGDWVDSNGKKHKGDSDSPRYRALGNSIALPFWEWLAERMVAQLHEDGVKKLQWLPFLMESVDFL